METKMKNWMNHDLKGKKNQMKIGDKVRAKSTWVDWHASNIAWLFCAPNDKGEKEIRNENLSEVYFLLNAKLGNKRPTGVISRYGCFDNDDDIDRKNVFVTFTLDTEFGDVQYSCYVHEKDVEVIKKAKSKRR